MNGTTCPADDEYCRLLLALIEPQTRRIARALYRHRHSGASQSFAPSSFGGSSEDSGGDDVCDHERHTRNNSTDADLAKPSRGTTEEAAATVNGAQGYCCCCCCRRPQRPVAVRMHTTKFLRLCSARLSQAVLLYGPLSNGSALATHDAASSSGGGNTAAAPLSAGATTAASTPSAAADSAGGVSGDDARSSPNRKRSRRVMEGAAADGAAARLASSLVSPSLAAVADVCARLCQEQHTHHVRRERERQARWRGLSKQQRSSADAEVSDHQMADTAEDSALCCDARLCHGSHPSEGGSGAPMPTSCAAPHCSGCAAQLGVAVRWLLLWCAADLVRTLPACQAPRAPDAVAHPARQAAGGGAPFASSLSRSLQLALAPAAAASPEWHYAEPLLFESATRPPGGPSLVVVSCAASDADGRLGARGEEEEEADAAAYVEVPLRFDTPPFSGMYWGLTGATTAEDTHGDGEAARDARRRERDVHDGAGAAAAWAPVVRACHDARSWRRFCRRVRRRLATALARNRAVARLAGAPRFPRLPRQLAEQLAALPSPPSSREGAGGERRELRPPLKLRGNGNRNGERRSSGIAVLDGGISAARVSAELSALSRPNVSLWFENVTQYRRGVYVHRVPPRLRRGAFPPHSDSSSSSSSPSSSSDSDDGSEAEESAANTGAAGPSRYHRALGRTQRDYARAAAVDGAPHDYRPPYLAGYHRFLTRPPPTSAAAADVNGSLLPAAAVSASHRPPRQMRCYLTPLRHQRPRRAAAPADGGPRAAVAGLESVGAVMGSGAAGRLPPAYAPLPAPPPPHAAQYPLVLDLRRGTGGGAGGESPGDAAGSGALVPCCVTRRTDHRSGREVFAWDPLPTGRRPARGNRRPGVVEGTCHSAEADSPHPLKPTPVPLTAADAAALAEVPTVLALLSAATVARTPRGGASACAPVAAAAAGGGHSTGSACHADSGGSAAAAAAAAGEKAMLWRYGRNRVHTAAVTEVRLHTRDASSFSSSSSLSPPSAWGGTAAVTLATLPPGGEGTGTAAELPQTPPPPQCGLPRTHEPSPGGARAVLLATYVHEPGLLYTAQWEGGGGGGHANDGGGSRDRRPVPSPGVYALEVEEDDLYGRW